MARACLGVVVVALVLCGVAFAFKAWGVAFVVVAVAGLGLVGVGWAWRGRFSGDRPYYWGGLGPVPYPAEIIERSGWSASWVLGILGGLVMADLVLAVAGGR